MNAKSDGGGGQAGGSVAVQRQSAVGLGRAEFAAVVQGQSAGELSLVQKRLSFLFRAFK